MVIQQVLWGRGTLPGVKMEDVVLFSWFVFGLISTYVCYRLFLLVVRYVFQDKTRRRLAQNRPLHNYGYSYATSSWFVAETSPFSMAINLVKRLIVMALFLPIGLGISYSVFSMVFPETIAAMEPEEAS